MPDFLAGIMLGIPIGMSGMLAVLIYLSSRDGPYF